MRYLVAIIGSTALWFVLPLSMELLDDRRTAHGWDMFWQEFPIWTLKWVGWLLIVAILMNLLLTRTTLRLRGWKFWVFPAISLPAACVAWWFTYVISSAIAEGIFPWSKPGMWSGVLYVFAVVLFSLVWISYPLAILNQLLIKKVHQINVKANHAMQPTR
jgi:hypothetical protein